MNETRRTIGGLALPALLLTLLLLFVSQTECRTAGESENESDIASLPPDVDNVELHRVKLVNGVMTEDHPILMYKEDFVNEDYDKFNTRCETETCLLNLCIPCADPTQSQTKAKPTRKYKQLKRMRHHYSTAEKIRRYPRNHLVNKKPKYRGKIPPWQTKPTKPSMPTDNDTRLGEPDENFLFHDSNPAHADFSVFDQPRPAALETKPTKPSMPTDNGTRLGEPDENSLFHDSNPAHADFSVFDQPRPAADTPRPSSSNWQTPTTRPPFGGFQSPPESPVKQPPRWEPRPHRRPATTRRTSPRLSSCVRAIFNCCSEGKSKIHYNCFEEFGCHGPIWGVNPCADNVRDGTFASSTGPLSLRQ